MINLNVVKKGELFIKKIFIIFLCSFLCSCTLPASFTNGEQTRCSIGNDSTVISEDFYFIHISDVHVKSKILDKNEISKKRFQTILENITCFPKKPVFIVITGDIADWGGSGILGTLNCRTVSECLHRQNGQMYADEEYTIPVYMTPGNHEYTFTRNLFNYHIFINPTHIKDHDRYIITQSDVALFFLDSGPNYYANLSILLDWHGHGLSNADIAWLNQSLNQYPTSHKIVLMHHPAVGDSDDLFINNRQAFVDLCEFNHVELVLAGHTHSNHRIFDVNLTKYETFPLNCSTVSTLYVQSDDCAEDCHYRNISLINDDIWLGENTEIDLVP